MTKKEIIKELRRLIKEAVTPIAGAGGIKECKYCLRSSYGNQPQHYRKGVITSDDDCGDVVEADDHCEVTVMKATLKELLK